MPNMKIDSLIFTDTDHSSELGLSYSNVSDPIKDSKGGTLTLHDIYNVFSEPATSYALIVDGQTWTVPAKKVVNGALNFTLPKMTSGDKIGCVYALNEKGNSLERASVFFDVDDITAPVVSGKLAATQSGNDFDLSWEAAADDSDYKWALTIKDGKNIVWKNDNISGETTSMSVSLNNKSLSGKKLTFELYAYQNGSEKGKSVTLTSKKLTAAVAVSDKDALYVTNKNKVFSDSEYAQLAGLEMDEYWAVSDPIKNSKGGTLTLYELDDAFESNMTIVSYQLMVDGKTYTVSAKKMVGGAVDFVLPKMTSGFKTGKVYALDATGSRSKGVDVHFDVDDVIAPIVSGKLAVMQHGNDFDISWAAAKDDSEYKWSLTIKDKNIVVWQNNNISEGTTFMSVSQDAMKSLSGKKLTFELYAHQNISEKGKSVTLTSKKLTAAATIKDSVAPIVLSNKVFSDYDHVESAGLTMDQYWDVADPIHNGKGKLVLFDVDKAFSDNIGIATYELYVDGKTFKTPAAKMSAIDGSVAFALSGISNGNKKGTVFAVDAAGNRSAGINVFFDADSKTY